MRKLKYIFGPFLLFLIYIALCDYIKLHSYHHLPKIRFADLIKRSDLFDSQKPHHEIIKRNVDRRKKKVACDDITNQPHYGQRGKYWVLYNYVTAMNRPSCDESITYTTHADYRFLDNLVPLVKRWRGPISISIYAPSTDFRKTLVRIQYLRQCGAPLIKEFVDFHIFFDAQKLPAKIPNSILNFPKVNCFTKSPIFGNNMTKTFRKFKKMVYPVNVARNIARDMAPTHYVLSSDIELYPSPNLIPKFFEMLQRKEPKKKEKKKKKKKKSPELWVLPIFEIDDKISLSELPEDKGELQFMLKNNMAIPFHQYVCRFCHRVPGGVNWIKQPYDERQSLRVFHTAKRMGSFKYWEPIFIGTKNDPRYDERLSWDGLRDKMTQGYILCVLDYQFHILNHAFLIHRPGIKRLKKDNRTRKGPGPKAARQNMLIHFSILPELKILYGHRKGCHV